ncbi:MAG: helix-turn-helix domain-containing protein [Bacteroidales bacterium]|nr:helix-turn-helix domain-containing protein [Bacteroidales bacterium]
MFLLTLLLHPIDLLKAEEPQFEKISFPHDYELKITSLCQDSLGFLWLGTREGLFRYDGYEMKKIFPKPDVEIVWRQHQIISVKENKGKIWFSIHIGKLMTYDIQTENISQVYPFENSDNFYLGRAISIDFGNDKEVWVGLSKGLLKLNEEDGTLKEFDNFKQVFNIWNDSVTSNTWILHKQNNISVINSSDSIIKTYIFKLKKNVREFRSGKIERDSYGVIWAAVGNEIYQYIPIKDSFNKIISTKNEIIDFAFDRNNRIWIIDAFEELAYYAPKQGKLIHLSTDTRIPGNIGSNNIFALLIDKSGVLFTATLNGLYKLDWTKQFFNNLSVRGNTDYLSYAQGASPGTVSGNTIYRIEKRVDYSVLIRAKVSTNTNNGMKAMKVYDFRLPEDVSVIKALNEKELWIVSKAKGLFNFNIKTEELKNINTSTSTNDFLVINDISSGKGNELWLATQEGVYNLSSKLNDNDLSRINELDYGKFPFLAKTVITSVHYDKEGMLWIGARGRGVYRYNPSVNILDHFGEEEEGSGLKGFKRISCMNETAGGTLWIGSVDDGIAFFDDITSRFQQFSTQNGLKENEVCSIIFENEQTAWISHIKGLTKVELPSMKFKHYSHENGLPSGQFLQRAGLRTENGIILFANTQGWCYFNPASMRTNPIPPSIFVEKVKVDGVDYNNVQKGSYANIKQVSLSDEFKKLEIKVLSLSFASSFSNKLAWKFIEKDEWNIINSPAHWIDIVDLDPGKHVLLIKAANNDEVWSTESQKIIISVGRIAGYWIIRGGILFISISILILYFFFPGQVKILMRKRKVDESKLNPLDKERIENLRQLMTEKKVFLNSDLSLKDLAKELHISTNTLSSLFNNSLNQNFYDFVNTYRVEYVQKLMESEEMKNYTLVSIGYESGFNSKSSFFRIFKKHTGKTPSEYIKNKI